MLFSAASAGHYCQLNYILMMPENIDSVVFFSRFYCLLVHFPVATVSISAVPFGCGFVVFASVIIVD